MKATRAAEQAADRLGLDIDEMKTAVFCVERRNWTVTIDFQSLWNTAPVQKRAFLAAWTLYGVRLGIDHLLEDDDKQQSSPMRFRRTNLRRYHEAPSVHGDRLPILVPRITRQIFETIADQAALFKPWAVPELEALVVRETGTRLEILTADQQSQSELSDEQRWEKVRSALFYQSYKVRPRQTVDVSGGTLRIFETSEGFGASRALLLPEFDYDAAREFGFLAVPTRDQIIIARPDDRQHADEMLQPLRKLIDEALTSSPFGLTDAVFQLGPNEVSLREKPTLFTESAGYDQRQIIADVSPPSEP